MVPSRRPTWTPVVANQDKPFEAHGVGEIDEVLEESRRLPAARGDIAKEAGGPEATRLGRERPVA
jgi:hypothetical protein